MRAILVRFWSIIVICLLWFAFSSPYFLQGKVPYASTYQTNFFAPWSYYEQFDMPVKNGAMPDIHSQIYPWKKFTVDSLRSGQIPFWNPYSFAGNPHLSNFQSAVLTPFNLLFLVVPFVDAWSMLVLLQPLLAGLFTYLFMRSLRISKIGSAIGSISFMFCGFIVVWMAYGTLAYAILYLPLALFAIEKFFQTKKIRFLLLLVFTIPFSFFSGHFQISVYFLLTAFAYCFFKGLATQDKRRVLITALSIMLGLIFSLPQILPSLELYRLSVRSGIFQVSEAIPSQYLLTIFAPDFFGNPVTRNDWFGHYAEWSSFIGIIPLMLALYMVWRKKSLTVWFFFLLGFISLLLAVRSPISDAIVFLKIPVISTSALSRVVVIFSFAFAVLAGLGIDQLRNDLENKKIKNFFPVLFVTGVFFAIVWITILVFNFMPDQWESVAKRNLVLPTVLFLVVSFCLLLMVRYKKVSFIGLSFLVFATSFDSFRFAQKWIPFDPKELVYPNVPIVEAISNNIGQGRIFGNIGSEATTYYHFPSIEGYDPLYIESYGEFIRSATSGNFAQAERSVVKLQRDAKYADRVLDLLGVTLVFHPIADTNQGWAYPVWKDQQRYKLVHTDDKFQLFQNTMALPRAALFYQYEVINDDRELLSRFYGDDFDFRNILLLNMHPGIDSSKEGSGSANITSYAANKINIKVTTNKPALLFLSDNHYPGWKATVNSNDVSIFLADYSFRGVVVPQGESEVEFTYENWHF